MGALPSTLTAGRVMPGVPVCGGVACCASCCASAGSVDAITAKENIVPPMYLHTSVRHIVSRLPFSLIVNPLFVFS